MLNSKGRVTQIVDTATTTKFAYDIMGRTTETQRFFLGAWKKMSQTYNALNQIRTETFPAPDNEIVTYNYNTAGWLQSVTATIGPNYINDIQYNARGQKTQLTYGNNITTNWTFDPNRFWMNSRQTGILSGQTLTPTQQNLTYTRDPIGNITQITDAISATGSRTFTYDDLSRLATAVGNFGPNQSSQNCTYVYNAIGDITNKCGTNFTYGHSMHPSAVTYNPATGKSYTYDANGNMLTRGNQTLTWDIDNRVSQISITGGGTTLMEYDYTGMRVKKNAPTGITLFPFQGYEIAPSGEITKFIKIGVETFASKRGAQKLYYHNDHLGSVHVITNETAAQAQLNEYDPWGGVSKSVGNIDPTHRFNGKDLDPESGLYYYGGRYYDPEISRFISPDPFIPQPSNPQSLNRYSYTLNNPQNYIDPSGFFFDKLFKAIGNFFKSIFKNPGVFFATLAVGIITGGVAFAAAPAAWSATTAWAFAGAVGGASAGAVGAAMTGGNIWQSALMGGITGGVGGGVFGAMGGVDGGFAAALAAGIAGGATNGAMKTAFYGGNFFQNTATGAAMGAALAVAQQLLKLGWEQARTWTDNSSLAQKYLIRIKNKWNELVTAGIRECPGGPCPTNSLSRLEMLPENSPINRIFGFEYDVNSGFGRFINQVSKVHDWMNGWSYNNQGQYVPMGTALDTAFSVYSFFGMPIAGAYTAAAFAPPIPLIPQTAGQ